MPQTNFKPLVFEPTCQQCGKSGHPAAKCFEMVGRTNRVYRSRIQFDGRNYRHLTKNRPRTIYQSQENTRPQNLTWPPNVTQPQNIIRRRNFIRPLMISLPKTSRTRLAATFTEVAATPAWKPEILEEESWRNLPRKVRGQLRSEVFFSSKPQPQPQVKIETQYFYNTTGFLATEMYPAANSTDTKPKTRCQICRHYNHTAAKCKSR